MGGILGLRFELYVATQASKARDYILIDYTHVSFYIIIIDG